MKKKMVIGVVIVLILALVIGLIIAISKDDTEDIENVTPTVNESGTVKAPSRVDENEKEVSDRKAQELFNFIPEVYTEEIAPFSSVFMLDAVMNKIIKLDEEQDFSVKNVDAYVTKLFGKEASIDKDEVAEPDIAKSLFYYSKEANTYAVIPAGYEGIFEYQIFKNATETDDAYYVYTYTLIGGYAYDENSIVQDEYGDIDYENTKVQLIVGDKDGNDLVHVFDKYSLMYDEEIWTKNYANIMPVFRYTLTKTDDGYYLTEVEQINY